MDILVNYKILGYLGYVDDVLIVHDHSNTDIDLVLQEFNERHPNLQYTIELEENKTINFLDLKISRGNDPLDFRTLQKIPIPIVSVPTVLAIWSNKSMQL